MDDTEHKICYCACDHLSHSDCIRSERITGKPCRVDQLKRGRVWFYRPQMDWDWAPIRRGHDEFARNTICIGWPFTGRLIITTGPCGLEECVRMRDKMLEDMGEKPW